MIFKTTVVGACLALAACGSNKPSVYFSTGTGHVLGFDYESQASSNSWGGTISMFPLSDDGTRISSEARVTGVDHNGSGRWTLLKFCGSEKLSGEQTSGCDIARYETAYDAWQYIPCEAAHCDDSKARMLSALTIQPVIDKLDAARNDMQRM